MDANELIKQLGGNKFIMMTGAKDFVNGGDYLQFQIPTRNKINRVRITLTPLDTYTMEFLNLSIRKLECKTIKVHEDVYADQLQELFTDVTGLYTLL
jgi:hypothetical protein